MENKKILIEAEVVFDGENILRDVSVVIQGDKILFLGNKNDMAEQNFESIISTKFLMPGLIDSHVHITGYKEGTPAGNPFKPMKSFLKLLISNGVTTVRDVGNNLETIMYLKKWIEKYPGPQIFSSGPLLDSPPIIWPSTRVVTTKEEVKTEINRLYVEEVDLIKVYKNIQPDILQAIIDEAHNKGLKVAGDLGATRASAAIKMNIDTLEHIVNLIDETYLNDKENNSLKESKSLKKQIHIFSFVDFNQDKIKQLIDTLVNKNVYVCPTLLVLKKNYYIDEMFNEPYLNYAVPIMPYHKYFKYMQNPFGRYFGLKQFKKHYPINIFTKEEERVRDVGFKKIIEFIKILSDKGVKIIVGTDTLNPTVIPGFSLHQEMKMLSSSGISSLDILKYATSIPAIALGKTDIGVVKQNAYANLLLINGNPVENIEEISKIEYIMLKGRLFKREELLKRATEE